MDGKQTASKTIVIISSTRNIKYLDSDPVQFYIESKTVSFLSVKLRFLMALIINGGKYYSTKVAFVRNTDVCTYYIKEKSYSFNLNNKCLDTISTMQIAD